MWGLGKGEQRFQLLVEAVGKFVYNLQQGRGGLTITL